MQEKRLTSKQLANRLGVSARTLRHWRHNENGPKWGRYGARVEYKLTDVEAWEHGRHLAMQEHYSTAELADLLDLSETTIVMWRWLEKGPAFEKMGRRVAYPKTETNQWAIDHGYKIK
jgi:DNA-binding XRE family transcriptional regulator